MIDYNKRLAEVSVILNHLKKSDYNKIPQDVIEKIEKNKDVKYIWDYDEAKDLKEQNVGKDTIAILSYINMKYLLNKEQKDFVQQIFNENQKKVENMKKEKYNIDNLFQTTKKEKNEFKEKSKELISYKQKTFIKKIVDKIISLLKI